MKRKGYLGKASQKLKILKGAADLRRDKRDLRTKYTEDSSISQAMLEMAQECVKAMNNEVAGLRERFGRTSQEAKEKLQQDKTAVSGSGKSHK